MQEKRLHLHYFMPTYALPLKNCHFLTEFSDVQKLKMAIYKGFRVSERSKKAKKDVAIADFSKIETRKKALYARLKGIPEGGLKAFKTKGFRKQ